MKDKEEEINDFMMVIHQMILYWDSQRERSSKEKMEGLAHSILCILDGVSGSYDGNIQKLSKLGKDFMFHDFFYKKNKD